MLRRVAVLALVVVMAMTHATVDASSAATTTVDVPTASVTAASAVIDGSNETAVNVTDGFDGLSSHVSSNGSVTVTELSVTTKVVAKSKSNETSSSSGSGSGADTTIQIPTQHTRDPDSSASGSGWGTNSSGSGSVGAGDVGYTYPVATTTAAPATTAAPTQSDASIGSSATDADANAQRAKDISGTSSNLFSAAAFVGFAGCAAIAVAAVYTRARHHGDDEDAGAPENPFEEPAPESIELRRTSSGVYNDPLGTRFSSIVMITPNGEGVCIL